MSFYLVQAGDALQAISSDGTQIQTLVLPAGVTIDPTIKGWFGVLNRTIVFAYASTINLLILPADLTVVPLSILAPPFGPTLSAGTGTGLTGDYRGACSFIIKDGDGNTINESPRTDISPLVTLANQSLLFSNIPLPTAATVDIDDVVTTSFDDSTSDDDLELLPADPTIEVPPGAAPGTALQILTTHKERIFAASAAAADRDEVIWSEVGKPYAFASDNGLNAPPVGADEFGVTGFLSRRDSLGCLKRRSVNKLIGDVNENFQMLTVAEKVGCYSGKSCVVINDKGYFLGIDGVYRWDDDGVVNITKDTVDGWFTSDIYFNRSLFPDAQGGWNPVANAYVLHVARAGSSVLDAWIKFMIDANEGKGEWLGPDETDAFDGESRALLTSDAGVLLSAIGGADGYVYLENANQDKDTQGDLGAGETDFRIDPYFITRWHADQDPEAMHVWGRMFVASRAESLGELDVTPYVGDLGASAQAPIALDLTIDHQFTRRLRVGRLASLKFQLSSAGLAADEFARFLVYGYSLPVFSAGTRK